MRYAIAAIAALAVAGAVFACGYFLHHNSSNESFLWLIETLTPAIALGAGALTFKALEPPKRNKHDQTSKGT